MKRSEMVELLLNEINDLLYTDSFISRDEANLILTKIERLGMLPPEKKDSWQYDLEHVQYAHDWDEE